MTERVYSGVTLAPPVVAKAIPYGEFFGIDQQFYDPKPPNETKHRQLRPYGMNVNHKNFDGFVAPPTPIGLSTGSLKVNYGSYLFQQLTGTDAAHPADVKTEPVVVFM
jgi:hypothetical protein